MPVYLQKMAEDMKNIIAELEQDDFESVRVRGHNIKGSGGAYGLDFISKIGGNIEQSAAAGNGDAVRAHLDELSTFIDNVKIDPID